MILYSTVLQLTDVPVHCKKRFAIFPPPAEMSLYQTLPGRESLESVIPAWDGKIVNLFYSVTSAAAYTTIAIRTVRASICVRVRRTVKLIVVWTTPIGKDDLKAYDLWGHSCGGKVKFREKCLKAFFPKCVCTLFLNSGFKKSVIYSYVKADVTNSTCFIHACRHCVPHHVHEPLQHARVLQVRMQPIRLELFLI